MSPHRPRTALGRAVHHFEEGAIAVLLGLMTLLTFANVVARYVFNDNILWALEMTGFLNAWMVMLGISYAMKIGAHLGVDALVNVLPGRLRFAVTMLACAATVAFAVLLTVGAWNYWAPFANLPPLYGSWFPQGFFEVEDVPMPAFLQGVADILNEGDEYEKMPRAIPYVIMPIGSALLLFRTLEATWAIARGERKLLIASHEIEEALDEGSYHGDDADGAGADGRR